jgi:hypothetical protein
MTIALRHAWLQKHGSPAASRGEFHWYPAPGDHDLRSSFVQRSRGIDPPAVLWELAPGRASWAQAFAATAPSDGRRYVGLVLTIAEHAASTTGELLDAIALPAPVPWAPTPGPATDRPRQAADPREIAAIARALLSGGDGHVSDPTSRDLPARVASLEHWMPAGVSAGRRTGVWRVGPDAGATDAVAELVAAAWRDPSTRAARAWRLLCELATASERSVDEVHAELANDASSTALTDEERAIVGASRDFTTVLHLWGRGRLDTTASSASLPARLADVVARRALACLIAGTDPAAAIAEARWHALLPAARRAALLDAVARHTASLRALVEGPHA